MKATLILDVSSLENLESTGLRSSTSLKHYNNTSKMLQYLVRYAPIERTVMRILVIGGTNFIGPHVVRRLVEDDHEVTVFNRGRTESELPRVARHVRGDT